MQPDDPVCLCFRVSLRKVQQFLAARRPQKASQLSDCYGAGTGCGWCRRYLQRLHEQAISQSQGELQVPSELPAAADYAAERQQYRAQIRSGNP